MIYFSNNLICTLKFLMISSLNLYTPCLHAGTALTIV